MLNVNRVIFYCESSPRTSVDLFAVTNFLTINQNHTVKSQRFNILVLWKSMTQSRERSVILASVRQGLPKFPSLSCVRPHCARQRLWMRLLLLIGQYRGILASDWSRRDGIHHTNNSWYHRDHSCLHTRLREAEISKCFDSTGGSLAPIISSHAVIF